MKATHPYLGSLPGGIAAGRPLPPIASAHPYLGTAPPGDFPPEVAPGTAMVMPGHLDRAALLRAMLRAKLAKGGK